MTARLGVQCPFENAGISSFPSVQKREPQRDTAQRNSFSFLDRLLLLDVPPSECSLSALRAPNPRLSTHKRIDADAPLPGRMTGHAASGGAGQEGEARCTRPLSRRSRRTAKRRGWAERGCGFWKSRFCGERGEKIPAPSFAVSQVFQHVGKGIQRICSIEFCVLVLEHHEVAVAFSCFFLPAAAESKLVLAVRIVPVIPLGFNQ